MGNQIYNEDYRTISVRLFEGAEHDKFRKALSLWKKLNPKGLQSEFVGDMIFLGIETFNANTNSGK